MTIAQLALLFAAATTPWVLLEQRDGLHLESQQVAGSGYERLRVSGRSKASAEVLAATWWGKADDISNNRAVSSREVLLDEPDRRLVYDIVGVPIGSDRDYVMRGERLRDPGSGAVTLRFRSVEDARRPVRDGRVRMQAEMDLVATPLPVGGCRFTYTVFNDVGGMLPSFLLMGPLRDGMLKGVVEFRTRAEANAATNSATTP